MIEDNPVQLSKLVTCIIRPDHSIKGKQKKISNSQPTKITKDKIEKKNSTKEKIKKKKCRFEKNEKQISHKK